MVLGTRVPGRVGRRRFFSREPPSGRLFSFRLPGSGARIARVSQARRPYRHASRRGRSTRIETWPLATRSAPTPDSPAEAVAAEVLADGLRAGGVAARIETVPGATRASATRSALIAALALAPAAAAQALARARARPPPRPRRRLLRPRARLRDTPLSRRALPRARAATSSRRSSPAARPSARSASSPTPTRSRSGLLFHPALGPHLQPLDRGPVAGDDRARAAEPLAGAARRRAGPLIGAARAVVAAGLALLAERELRGEDVPGANDNASGAAAVVAAGRRGRRRAARVDPARRPDRPAREEAGLLGARAFLDAHETDDWLFLNFDGVGAPATLRYLPREGVGRTWHADPAAARRSPSAIARTSAPSSASSRSTRPIGPHLRRDRRARPRRAGAHPGRRRRRPDPQLPPADATPSRTSTATALGRALAVGRELIAMIDRGEADRA